ncbi:MAG: hypothetical protein M3357_16100, partial [Actinomycetota bacterium]|nr:hypothetical protein [Actinomycetota bacterium]
MARRRAGARRPPGGHPPPRRVPRLPGGTGSGGPG